MHLFVGSPVHIHYLPLSLELLKCDAHSLISLSLRALLIGVLMRSFLLSKSGFYNRSDGLLLLACLLKIRDREEHGQQSSFPYSC